MKNFKAPIILLTLLISPATISNATQTTLSREDYAVYSLAIEVITKSTREGLLTIKPQTQVGDFPRPIQHDAPPSELWQEFEKLNRESTSLRREFVLSRPYHLGDDGTGYGFPVISLSRVAFTATRAAALINVTYSLGGDSEKSWYLLLVKEGDSWRLSQQIPVLRKAA